MNHKVVPIMITLIFLLWACPAFADKTYGQGQVVGGYGATGTINAYNINDSTIAAAMAVITNPNPAPKSNGTNKSEDTTPSGGGYVTITTHVPGVPGDDYEVVNATTPYKGVRKGTDYEVKIPIPPVQPPLEPIQWEDGSGIRATILYWEWSGYNQDTGRSIETKRTPAAPEPQTTYVFSEPGKYQITASAWTRYQPLKCIKRVEVLYDDKGNAIGLSDPIEEWVPDGPPYEDWGRRVVFEVTVTVDDLGKPIVIPSTETNVGVKVVKVDETKGK